ncbi:acyl-CoA dehydrogenase [Streptomyces sp. NPDC014623]|uniref:acyl-CoA dehydrogenase family protein n=1 Tax=Streptomyces sp. NPDC014623 TaxID=3364875 RepID=UPI0036FE6D26
MPSSTSEDRDELIRLVFDGTFDSVHADLRDTVSDPLFAPRSGLDATQQGRLAYDRSRLVHARTGPAQKVLDDPLRLFALSEWPSLMDTTTLPLLMSHYNLCLGTLLHHSAGRDDLDDIIEELATMRSVGMLMVTELGFGNNAAAMRTRAVYDPLADEFVLSTPDPQAQKFMPYTGIQDIPKIAVVMARLVVQDTDRGIFPFIVRICDAEGLLPGVRATALPDKPGLALDNGVTWFDGVRLPRRNLLGGAMGRLMPDGTFESTIPSRRRRFLTSLERVQPGRLCLASALVAAGRASLYIALRYARQRKTFAPGESDVPVIAYRSQQTALFRALADVYAMTFLVNSTKRAFVRTGVSDDTNHLISLTKVVSSWSMTDVLTTCRERTGAQGMFSANRIADYIAMAQGVVTAEGDNLPLLAKAGNELLAHPPATDTGTPEPQGRSLTDPSFHRELTRFRQSRLTDTTAYAMRREIRGGSSLFDAWNHHINAALTLAESRGRELALEELHTAATQATTPRTREALGLLAALYGLGLTERDAAWHLAHGTLTPHQVTRIPTLLEALSTRVLPYADLLVDGFGLTDELLRAPALRPGLTDFHA